MINRRAIAALFIIAEVASGKLFTEDVSSQKELWSRFKSEYKKQFESLDEETRRFNLFLSNLQLADDRNELELSKGGKGIHGITKFSDLSQAEFKSFFLNADKSMKSDKPVLESPPHVSTTDALVDWTGILTTPVKDQGYCGGCWAFSAVEQIESDAMRLLATEWILSPEQLIQCTSSCFGCSGGWTENAFKYAEKNPVEQNSNYPYTSYNGLTGMCSYNKALAVVLVNTYTALASDETAMANYVQTTGPLSICLDASNWSTYTGGILTVCGTDVDHCVQAVGVYPDPTYGYWKIRNSWGTSWGEAGYIQLAYGQNTCDLTNDPIFTNVGFY